MHNNQNAVTKLEAISEVRPEMKPVVQIALDVVKAAEAEVIRAEARVAKAQYAATQAVETLGAHVTELADQVEELESEREAREQIERSEREAAEAAQRDQRSAVAKRNLDAAIVDVVNKATAAITDQERLMDETRLKFIAAHHYCDPSLITTTGEPGAFVVRSFCGEFESVVETRADAVDAIGEVVALALEKRAAIGSNEPDPRSEDAVDTPRRRRTPQPGENRRPRPKRPLIM